MNASLPTLLALVATLSLPACQDRPDAGGPANAVGKVAPTVTGKTIDGDYVALSDHRGDVVLLNIWATWCKPCKQELPELANLHDTRGPEGFTVFSISVDRRQHLAKVHQMRRVYDLKFPIVFDPAGHAAAAWDVGGYPTSVLIGRDGTIRWRRTGVIAPGDPELTKQLDAALAEPRPAPAQ